MIKNDFEKMTVSSIKAYTKTVPIEGLKAVADCLLQDDRTGVQKLGVSVANQYAKYQKALEKCKDMQKPEQDAYARGYTHICGVDEVGRGPLAGPVVCASVILPKDSKILYIDDSKKLSQKKREALNAQILEEAVDVQIGLRDPEVIDMINILEATKAAMKEAVLRLKPQPDLVFVDALSLELPMETKGIIHGDALCYSIAAASIVAKVYRDRLMQEYHALYPQYGFDRNMGYGTAEHIQAIHTYGLTPIHRHSFVKNIV